MHGTAIVIAPRTKRIASRAHLRQPLPAQPRDWRNPSRMARMLAVAAFFAFPGFLAGALLGVVLGGFFVAAAVGALLTACFGAWFEGRS